MSIFGPKREYVPKEIQIDKEITKQIDKEITKQIDKEITKQINEELTGQINSLISRQLTLVKTEQSNLYSAVGTLNTKIDKLENKRIITIWAESKGPLKENEMFSFGNGGKVNNVGYSMLYKGRIKKMGLSTQSLTNEMVVVYLAVNANIHNINNNDEMYTIRCYTAPRTNPSVCLEIETFEMPWEVSAGDIIGFRSGSNSGFVENTVVSAIIEIDIDT